MFDQDDQRNGQPYTGPAVLRTLTWAPRTTREVLNEISDLVNGSDESIPVPLQATMFSPHDFKFGSQRGLVQIAESDPHTDRLEGVAINFVKISQFFGGGQWLDISSMEYRTHCHPRAVLGTERSLFIDLVRRGCLVARGDKYAIGPHMAFFLSKHIDPLISAAA